MNKGKIEVMDVLHKYKDAFSYHVKEEDKALIDREMRHLCYLSILKEGFSAYSSRVMLISRKVIQDKRMVTDFRHLSMRIEKNNLAYPLL